MGRDASRGGQLGLGFGDAAATDRLFFAAFPDPGAAAGMQALARRLRWEHRLGGRPLPAERFHVTLLFLGDYPADLWRDIAEKAIQAAQRIRLPSFRAEFDRVASFASRRQDAPLVLRGGNSEGLRRLHACLHDALRAPRVAFRAEREFVPHATLMYDERRLPETHVEPISWRVDGFALVRSPIGKGAYQRLGDWPLQAAPQLKS